MVECCHKPLGRRGRQSRRSAGMPFGRVKTTGTEAPGAAVWMWAGVWGLARLAKIKPTAAELSAWFSRTRPVPLAAELLGGVSCAPLRAAAKRLDTGELDPAVS